jgi:hypothetical protein
LWSFSHFEDSARIAAVAAMLDRKLEALGAAAME